MAGFCGGCEPGEVVYDCLSREPDPKAMPLSMPQNF